MKRILIAAVACIYTFCGHSQISLDPANGGGIGTAPASNQPPTIAPVTNTFRVLQPPASLLPILSIMSTDGVVSSRVVGRSANNRVWQRINIRTNAIGQILAKTNTVTEMQSGMHRRQNGQWIAATPAINITNGAAVGLGGSHQTWFSPNLNSSNAVQVLTPDGVLLRTQILGLGFYDYQSESNVMIAELKDSVGTLVGTNLVVYSNAFTGFRVDVHYTYSKAGLEQDIVLRQRPPLPEDFGLNPDSTRLEVWTEFFDPPQPVRHQQLRKGWLKAKQDQTLDFGSMSIGSGTAFALGKTATRLGFAIDKQWVETEGRTFLVEDVSFRWITPHIRELPSTDQASINRQSPDGSLYVVSTNRLLPKVKTAMIPSTNTIRRVEGGQPSQSTKVRAEVKREPALVLDYSIVNSETNYVFKAGQTYYISGTVDLNGDNNVIEGGSVLKFDTDAQLNVVGNLRTLTGPANIAVLTAKDDDSVGDILTNSTGVVSGRYASTALSLQNGGSLDHLRILYAQTAIASQTTFGVSNMQVLHCDVGLDSENSYFAAENILMYDVLTNFGGRFFHGTVEHLTAHDASLLAYDREFHYYGESGGGAPSSLINLRNSLTVCVTNGYGAVPVNTDSVRDFSSDDGIFVTVGGGMHYLASDTNRACGTISIDPTLWASLTNKTTHPPSLWTNITVGDTNLPLVANRISGLPDLGYAYDPIDYLVDNLELQGTLTLATRGAIAFYGPVGHGLYLGAGSFLVSEGTATANNRLVRYNTVQEDQSFGSSDGNILIIRNAVNTDLSCWFTEFSCLPGTNSVGSIMADAGIGSYGCFTFRDCTFDGGDVAHMSYQGGINYIAGLNFNNCLFNRTILELTATANPLNVAAYNNYFRGSTLLLSDAFTAGNAFVTAKDNVFKEANITQDPTLVMSADYNAYFPDSASLSPPGSYDQSLTNFNFISGPFGPYYQDTNSPLINMGSRGADAAGLFHYTVLTSEAKELASTVDIGLHYVALGAFSRPADSDFDNIPDYAEDRNGDGVWNIVAESSWTNSLDPFVCLSAPSGLIGWWKAETNALDQTGTNHGTAFNGVSFVDGVVGRAFSFAGSNQYVHVTNKAALRVTNGLTIDAWIYLAKSNYQATIFTKWDAVSGYNQKSFDFSIRPDGLLNFLVSGNGTDIGEQSAICLTPITPRQWTHVASTYDGTSLKVYTNGSLAASTLYAGGIYPGTNDLGIGGCIGGATPGSPYSFSTFHGFIDEVSMYNRGLSAPEIQALYLAGKAGKCPLPPAIISQPVSVATFPSSNATFTVTAQGALALAYQWRQGGTNVAGATNSTFTISNVQSNNLGNYTVVVTNSFGAVTSSIATLGFDYPVVTIITPTNSSAFIPLANIPIQATASNHASSITNVTFYRGAIPLVRFTNSPFTFNWTNVPAGVYTLTAVAQESHGLSSTSSQVSVTVGSECFTNTTLASNNAFGGGFLMNLNYTNSAGRLQLNPQTAPFNFLNIAWGEAGTLLRLDTSTTNFVGEYRTAPETKPSFPGHMVVDRYGNTWVANWEERGCLDNTHNGSVAEIGLVIGGTRGNVQKDGSGAVTNFVAATNGLYLKPPFIYSTAVDRDGDGYIKTSFGLTNVLNWPSNSPSGSVLDAEDECIIKYIRVPSQFACALALDTNNDLWVGGYCKAHVHDCLGTNLCGTRLHMKVDGITGQILTNTIVAFTNSSGAWGGFESIIDGTGVLWSLGGANPNAGESLVRYNPFANTTNVMSNTGDYYFGAAVDPQTGNIWLTRFQSNQLSVFSPSGSLITNYYHGSSNAGGLTIDNAGNVWVAHGPWSGGKTVGHLRTDGAFVGNVDLTYSCSGVQPASAVSIGSDGKIWAITTERDTNSANFVRIDPNAGTTTNIGGTIYHIGQVDCCLAIPYHTNREAYGDATGQKLLAATTRSGFWSVTVQGVTNQLWGTLSWTASTTDTNQVRVEIRTGNSYSELSSNLFQMVRESVPFTNSRQYLEIRTTLVQPVGVVSSPWLQDLTYDCGKPPTVTVAPASPSVCPGSNLTFTATASGFAPFSYVWRKDGVQIPGVTASSLLLTNIASSTNGLYSVEVTAGCFGAATNSSSLTVWTNLIVDGPSSQTVCPGTNVTFSTTINAGTGPFSFVWKKNSIIQTAETNSSLTVTNVGAADAGTYTVEVTSLCLKKTNSATLTVLTTLTASGPSDIVTNINSTARFTTTASGSGPFTYQWYKNGTNLSGHTNSSYTISSVALSNMATYSVLVAGPCNSASNFATLTVVYPLSVQITNPSYSQGFVAVTNLTIQASAAGSNALQAILFYENSTNLLGSVAASNNGSYQLQWQPVFGGTNTLTAKVIDSAGSNAVSGPVTIFVRNPPSITITNPITNSVVGPSPINIAIGSSEAPDLGAAVTNVAYYEGTTLLGSDVSSGTHHGITWPSAPSGVHTIYAKALDTRGAVGISPSVRFTVVGTNSGPFVDAGTNQTIRIPNAVHLLGMVTDDGLPPGNPLTIHWARTNGPGTVTFGDSNNPATIAAFSTPGTNYLRLTADDGVFTNSAIVTVTVLPTNAGPSVSAGTNQLLVLGAKFINETGPIAPQDRSGIGKEYWIGFPHNSATGYGLTNTLMITSEKQTFGSISIPWLGFFTNFSVAAHSSTTVEIPPWSDVGLQSGDYGSTGCGFVPKGVHVLATEKVSVYGFCYSQFSTDGYLAIPKTGLGTNYVVSAYPDYSSELLVVGTEKGTTLSVTASRDISLSCGLTLTGGVPCITNLDQGQTFEIQRLYLEGTIISSDKPVAVFGGNMCTEIHAPACNFICEQLPPTSSWGRRFYTAPLYGRIGGDFFQILAQANGTVVSINSDTYTLAAGQVTNVTLADPGIIEASKPILVSQFCGSGAYANNSDYGDPLMMLVTPVEQFATSYNIIVPNLVLNDEFSSYWSNILTVIIPSAATGSFSTNDVLVGSDAFTSFAGSGYSWARFLVQPGAFYRLGATAPFGVWTYGLNTYYDAYGYPAGACSGPVANVGSISLSPANSTNFTTTTFCISATVSDTNSEPLSGVPVEFAVTGSNPCSGIGYSDDQGKAQFCYIGASIGTDTIQASAGTNTASMTTSWKYPFLTLNGFVSDDGLPSGVLTNRWSQRSGPSAAVLANSNSTDTEAQFADEGIFAFRLTAGDGELTSFGDTTVTIVRNQPPAVDAGTNQITTTGAVTLLGHVSDDGLPSGSLAVWWRTISGPAAVTFGNISNATTTASFSSPGDYLLRLSASDCQATISSDIWITNTIPCQPISCGQAIAGTLSSSSRGSIRVANSKADYYRLNGLEGAVVAITMSTTNFDSYLAIRTSTLELLADDDDYLATADNGAGFPTNNARIVFTIPKSGDYIIEAASADSNLGTYTLNLTCGEVLEITSPTNGQRFAAGADIPISVDFPITYGFNGNIVVSTNGIFLGNCNGGPHPWGYDGWHSAQPGEYFISAQANLYLRAASSEAYTVTSAPVRIRVGLPQLTVSPVSNCPALSGQPTMVTASLTDSSGSPLNATDFVITVTGANSHTVSIPTNVSSITYSYTGTNAGHDVIQISAIAGGQTNTATADRNWAMPINCGNTFLGTLTTNSGASSRAGYARFFAFNAISNQFARIALSSTNFDSYLAIRDTACVLVATNDHGAGRDAQISFTAPAVGYYIIEATSFESSQTGSFSLDFDCNPVTSIGSAQFGILQNGQSLSNYATVNFGATTAGTTNIIAFSLTNSGNAPLFYGGIVDTNTGFGFSTLPTNLPIVPGGSSYFTMQFYSAIALSTNTTVKFFNNGGIDPFVFNVTAVANPAGSAPVISLAFPTNNSVFQPGAFVPFLALTNGASGVVVTQVEFIADTGTDWYLLARTNSPTFTNNWFDPIPGNYSIFALGTDDHGRQGFSDRASIQILNPVKDGTNNVPPVAVDDQYSILPNSHDNVFKVLDNDSDTNGFPLRIVSVSSTHSVVPRIINNGTAISYTPLADHVGSDWFTYTISDGHGGAASAYVDVTIPVPSLPTISITAPAATTNIMAGTSLTVTATASANSVGATIANVTFYNGDIPIRVFTNSPYAFTWTPVVGTYHLQAIVTDSLGQQKDAFTPAITVTRDTSTDHNPPLAAILNLTNQSFLIGPQLVTNGTPLIRDGLFGLTGTADDADVGDAVSYRLNLLDPSGNYIANITPGSLNSDGYFVGRVSAGGPLGTLDFTHIQNGPYILELVVRGGYQETNVDVPFTLECNLKIGQFSFSQQDLVIPAAGIPLSVVRTYNSLNPNRGDFGYSWSWALNAMDVQLNEVRTNTPDLTDPDDTPFSQRVAGGRDVTLTLPDGRRTTFSYYLLGPGACNDGDSIGGCYFARYQSAPGVTATLTVKGEGQDLLTSALYGFDTNAPLYWQGGSPLVPTDNYDFPGWILTTLDGTQYIIKREDLGLHDSDNPVGLPYSVQAYGQPYLSHIIESNGNTIYIKQNSIAVVDVGGHTNRYVTFQRNADGLISAIFDPISQGNTNNPSVKYEYDSNQNLLNVLTLQDRDAGTYSTISFTYTNSRYPHFITGVIDPRGVPLAHNEYNDAGELTATVDANGNRTEFSNNPTGHVQTVVDRMQRTNSYVYDLRGNVIWQTNALRQIARIAYDDNNLEIARTNAFDTSIANWTTNRYDAYGNLLITVTSLHTNRFTYDNSGNLISQIDPLGNFTTNYYDASGNLTNTIHFDPQNNRIDQSVSIHSGGHLVETRDANQNTTALFSYTGENLTSSTDAKGFTHTFGYDSNGNQISSSYLGTNSSGSPTNITTSTEYDALGRVIRSIDADGNTNSTVYNALGKVDYTVDKFGNTNSFLYDTRGNLIQTIAADGLITRTVYDSDGRPFFTTDRNQQTGTHTYYDALGRATNRVRLLGAQIGITEDVSNPGQSNSIIVTEGTAFSTNSTVYDDLGRVTSRTGSDRQTTNYTYYEDGQTKTVSNALHQVTTYAYDAAGRQKYVADALNHTNQFVFDALGRNIKTIFADDTFVTNVFSQLGQQVGKIDQASNTISYAFDISGQLTNVTMPSVPDPEHSNNPANSAWNYAFDFFSRQIATIDAKGRPTTNVFDALGREVYRILPLGQTETNIYNSKGQLWKHIDFKGQTNEMVYDKLGRVKAKFYFAHGSTYPSNAVCYQYDQLGRISQITERSGADASANACDLYSAMVRPLGSANSHNRFYAALAKIPDPVKGGASGTILIILCAIAVINSCLKADIGRIIACGCAFLFSSSDGKARLYLRLRIPGQFWRYTTYFLIVCLLGSDPRLDFFTLHAYAQCNIPNNASTDATRITTFSYDFDSHLTQVNCPEGVINYSYDLATGRHASTCTANSYIQYGYDELGRLKTVSVLKRNGEALTIPEIITYSYDDVGNRSSMSLPNGVVTSYGYDSLNRLVGLTNSISGAILSSFTYQLHSTGRRMNALEILKTEDATLPWITNNITWSYDQMYRLTNENLVCSTGTNSYNDSYVYDLTGNRLNKTHVQNGVTTSVNGSFNENDQLLTEVTLTNGVPSESNSYAYDANGSLTAKTNVAGSITITLYGYNLKNKLSNVSRVGGTTTNYFVYNDQGIRVRTASSSGGNPTLYLIDANNHTGYQQILEELSGFNLKPNRSYVLGDDVLAQGGSQLSYLLYDGHGSTRQLVDSFVEIFNRYNYDAYGTTLSTSTSAPQTSLLYCGQQLDPTLGMYNLRARYYDPVSGTFAQRDTFQGNSDDPQSLHKYLYCYADPINGKDPSGRSLTELLVAIAIIAVNLAFLYHDLNSLWNARSPEESLEASVAVTIDLIGFFTGPGPRVGMFATTQIGKQLAIAGIQYGGKLAVVKGAAAIAGRLLWGVLVNMAQQVGSVGQGSGGGSGPGEDIALGVGENLDEFANSVGAKSYEEWGAKDFQANFDKVCSDPNNRIHFNLTGPTGEYISPWIAARNPNVSITNWEISEIFSHTEWWDRVTFYYKGKPIPFPFK